MCHKISLFPSTFFYTQPNSHPVRINVNANATKIRPPSVALRIFNLRGFFPYLSEPPHRAPLKAPQSNKKNTSESVKKKY